jgi:DNA processing protein
MQTKTDIQPVEVAGERTLRWLALSTTPGIGAGRGRKLVEYFDGVERLFAASLTELEAAGIPAAAAQSIALGKSLELAADELDKVKAAGAAVIAQDDERYPHRLKEIYDPPLVLYVRGSLDVIQDYGLAVVVRVTRRPTELALRSDSLVISRHVAWWSSVGWRGALTRQRIGAP